MAKKHVPISVLVATRNEEKNIRGALESVKWADEVFVVDSQSEDATLDIAREYGAKIVQFHYAGKGPKKRSWALRNLSFSHDWILVLDADERVSPELKEAINRVCMSEPAENGFYVKRKLYFMDRWLKHSGWYPNWILRVFRLGKGHYEDLGGARADPGDVETHEKILVQGEVGRLQADIIHEDRRDLFHYISRMNRYSGWNAQVYYNLKQPSAPKGEVRARLLGDVVQRRRFLKRIWVRLPFRMVIRFLYDYIFKLGFLEGRPGFIWCAFKAIQEFHISAKMYEMELKRQGKIPG